MFSVSKRTIHGLRLLAVSAGLCLATRAEKQAVAIGRGGAAATISAEATDAALEILDRGGNAIDAAVAASATLGVTDPFSCGIGGGGFMLIYLAGTRDVISVDFRESAPASVGPEHFVEGGVPLPLVDAVESGRSVGVPGTVRGWSEVLNRYGKMSMAEVLAPAIRVAEEGFTVDANFFRLAHENVAKFSRFRSAAALYLRDGRALPIGTHFKNPDLAQTYRLLARKGVAGFYSGELAAAIIEAVNRPPVAAGKHALPGNMTASDLRDYEVRLRAPIRSTYRGYEVVGFPPPSSGGLAIAEGLNILEEFPLEKKNDAEFFHLFVETSRLVFADRNAYVGDSEFVDVPREGLMSKKFARGRAALIDNARAHLKADAGDPFLFQHDTSVVARPPLPESKRVEPSHTTHLAVSDGAGNIVACTFTIEAWGGSGIVVPGYGFILNNELTDFDFSAPSPNVPEARKRPRSSMSPTIVFRAGKPFLAVGSPGGSTIITTVLQILADRLGRERSLEEAIARPRLSQRNGATTRVEKLFRFTESTEAADLEKVGHRWDEVEEMGAANALEFRPDGTVLAVSEPRRHGGGSARVQKPDTGSVPGGGSSGAGNTRLDDYGR